MAKSGLGKGLGALIGSTDKRTETARQSPFPVSQRVPHTLQPAEGEAVREVPLAQLKACALQPRRHFREDQLQELVESIRQHGVIQPLIVRPTEGDQLELIAGERRWRACQQIAEITKVPVIIRQASDQDVLEMALIENLQREDLDPIEEAEAYVRLSKDFGLIQEEIAKRVGKSRASVANAMRLIELDSEVQTHLAQGRLSVGHAKVLLALKDQSMQRNAAETVIKQGMTVRATEKLLHALQNETGPDGANASGTGGSSAAGGKATGKNAAGAALPSALQHIQNTLRDHLATSVRLIPGTKKGRIEIEYYGDEDLERLVDVMGLKLDEF